MATDRLRVRAYSGADIVVVRVCNDGPKPVAAGSTKINWIVLR